MPITGLPMANGQSQMVAYGKGDSQVLSARVSAVPAMPSGVRFSLSTLTMIDTLDHHFGTQVILKGKTCLFRSK